MSVNNGSISDTGPRYARPDVIANTRRVERYTRAQEIYDLRAVAATFDAAELNRTAVRSSESKSQMMGDCLH